MRVPCQNPCAVQLDCLSHALQARPDGIWGGITLPGQY